jgi:signal transduction histidine kinase
MQRAAVFAAVSIVVLVCAAVAVWIGLVRSVADTMTVQARTAAELFDARVPVGEALARTLARPGIHILIADRRSGIAVDAGSAGVHVLPAAPGFPDRPNDGNPPPPGSPGAGPPRHGPVGTLALSLARLPPVRIDHGDRAIEIAPDVNVLARWLTIEALVLLGGIVAVAGIAANRASALERGRRRALEARAAEQAAAAERFRRFLAEAGHELRTPLTVMAGYVEILRTRDERAALDERVVEGMHTETSRMRMLVEKMMTLARLESDVAVPRLVDVAGAAREAAQTVLRRYPARDVDVRINSTGSIVIDADDFAAALGNLVENAVKHAPDSPVVIETWARDGSASTAVIDRGPGIADADRDAIFEQFRRGRASGEGLGLGLAIVKRVADRWNGSVECRSSNGSTIFRLSFPLADEERHDVAG